MKRILITGADSYIGTSVEKWLQRYPGRYETDTIDMRNDTWKQKSFSPYDVVFHVAGIAHVSTDPKYKDLYYRVNRDLAIETARKAKKEGVGQFIFMSSIIVYGDSCRGKVIHWDTEPKPANFYGDSKLQAEDGIRALCSESFKVVILRPPIVYGKGAKGNYPKLAKAAKKLPFFPDMQNKRSMLHIDNLCEFVRLMIDNEESGTFFPQNAEYVSTSELVRLIARVHGKNIRLTRLFNPALKLMGKFTGLISKVFGDMAYDMAMSEYRENYRVWSLEESIAVTEDVGSTGDVE